MPDVITAQKLDQALHAADAKIEEAVVNSLESYVFADQTDPLWLSALRGRVLAAIASASSLAASGTLLYQQIAAMVRAGPSADGVATVAAQAAAVTDAGLALVVAAASLIGLLASINSKAREWLRARFP